MATAWPGDETMTGSHERRGAVRVVITERLGGRARATLEVRLLDLSATGARIAHLDLLRPGVIYAFQLPPALGALPLSVRVVHSRVVGTEPSPAGERILRYESGVVFLGLTEEQRSTLERLIAQLVPDGKPPDRTPPGKRETNGGSPS